MMGKIKQRYNAKARGVSRVKNRRSTQDKPLEIQEETEINKGINNMEYSTVLEPNPGIIKSIIKEKRVKEARIKNILSKRKRKQLDKIKEKRKKSEKVLS